jgi:hypothetical protein
LALASSVLDQAEALINSADKCLRAARALMEAVGHRELMDDFLTRTINAADEAERILERALVAEAEADEADAAGRRLTDEAGLSASLGPVELAHHAEVRASNAKQMLADETDRPSRLLRARCEAIRADAKALLSELMTASVLADANTDATVDPAG